MKEPGIQVKALLVDDDPTSRYLIRRAVTREFGWSTVDAVDGETALVALAGDTFDVVFLDVHMPGMDGMTLLKQLRAAAETATLPIIMMTSEKDEAVVREAITLGVAAYLVKPLRLDQVVARIGRTLTRLRGPAKGDDPAPPTLAQVSNL
jgi:DNA-binding response OmpR family regulator